MSFEQWMDAVKLLMTKDPFTANLLLKSTLIDGFEQNI